MSTRRASAAVTRVSRLAVRSRSSSASTGVSERRRTRATGYGSVRVTSSTTKRKLPDTPTMATSPPSAPPKASGARAGAVANSALRSLSATPMAPGRTSDAAPRNSGLATSPLPPAIRWPKRFLPPADSSAPSRSMRMCAGRSKAYRYVFRGADSSSSRAFVGDGCGNGKAISSLCGSKSGSSSSVSSLMTTGAMRCWAGRHGGKRCVERYEPLVARPSRSGMAVVAMCAHIRRRPGQCRKERKN